MSETTKFTPFGKVVVGLGLAAAAFFSVRHFAPELLDRLAPEAKGVAPSIPSRADLPPLAQEPSPAGATAAIALPGNQPGCTDKPEVRMYLWAWNAQMGLMFANGGPQSTRGSLMCERGANVRFVREDDSGKMQEALVAFANELKGGAKQPTKGAHFVAIMGDGGATFLKGVNDTLKRLGPDYIAKVVGSAGYSRGEDKFMGPAAWKANPAASRGGFVAGVLRDGDWNIVRSGWVTTASATTRTRRPTTRIASTGSMPPITSTPRRSTWPTTARIVRLSPAGSAPARRPRSASTESSPGLPAT